jgi:hypothetical protein
MTERGNAAQPDGGKVPHRLLFRWECSCQQSPVLLATYDDRGRINIKARDRYWHVQGTVQTVCPRCGSEHTLDLRGEARSREGDGETASRPIRPILESRGDPWPN